MLTPSGYGNLGMFKIACGNEGNEGEASSSKTYRLWASAEKEVATTLDKLTGTSKGYDTYSYSTTLDSYPLLNNT
jgi:hypothetical protein